MKPTNGLLLEHLARYYFATPYVSGRVLDIACGVGYGAHMMAKMCKKEATEIVAVDCDRDTIAYANKTYNHPLVQYRLEDALDPDLPKKLGQFDTIVSFETIEHLRDDRLFMNSLYEMLRPGGILVLSTPFGQGRGKPCSEPFHVHQFTQEEFAGLFHAFSEVELYYQRGVTIEPPRRDVKYYLGVAVCKK
ncbi:MAG: methyltransferase domain-containing protein [Brevibacillus sp.]|nr:methyltransferase domain-containing protein [Brevibacillus sp.]